MAHYYLAPLEGITGYIFRNAVLDLFSQGIEKVYAPFIMPHIKIPMSKKDTEDIGPWNNTHGLLVPQILTNDADGFKLVENAMRDYGYKEINLNLGCPSKTVTGKGRGSGFLKYPEALDNFLYQIYEDAKGPISIKTRIGDADPEEFYKLLEIYNKYPIHELTIHPRLRSQAYNGTPYTEFYYYALMNSKNPVCYNGDIYNSWSLIRLISECPKEAITDHTSQLVPTVMLGRGMIRNPGLIRELSGGAVISSAEIEVFLRRLKDDYSKVFSGDTPVLFKLKEIWAYMRVMFPESDHDIRKMLKSKSLAEYSSYERRILSEHEPRTDI